ncbi:hypothetical protein BGZ94_007844 [Podila epigama]|nr:hypothetical protein BGZ94_007844 [Podila epigama]
MPHIIEHHPSPTASVATGIGIGIQASPTSNPNSANMHHQIPESTLAPFTAHALQEEEEEEHTQDLDTDIDYSRHARKQHKRKRDLFSALPANVLQQILGLLPPFQMLTISELSRKFYNFVVLGQEMNEVWFRLVKTEEAEQKKRLEWYKTKKLEQEQRQVQMMRSFSASSTGSTASYGNGYGPSDEPVAAISKQAQRLLNKKQEAKTGSRPSTVKAMRRSDRKKNWCQYYVDTILRGNGEDPFEALNQAASPAARKVVKFQTIILNESLAEEHLKEFHKDKEAEAPKAMSKQETREAQIQTKLDKRMYYKSIRSKPKGKKAGQIDPNSAKIDHGAQWSTPEWQDVY